MDTKKKINNGDLAIYNTRVIKMFQLSFYENIQMT